MTTLYAILSALSVIGAALAVGEVIHRRNAKGNVSDARPTAVSHGSRIALPDEWPLNATRFDRMTLLAADVQCGDILAGPAWPGVVSTVAMTHRGQVLVDYSYGHMLCSSRYAPDDEVVVFRPILDGVARTDKTMGARDQGGYLLLDGRTEG